MARYAGGRTSSEVLDFFERPAVRFGRHWRDHEDERTHFPNCPLGIPLDSKPIEMIFRHKGIHRGANRFPAQQRCKVHAFAVAQVEGSGRSKEAPDPFLNRLIGEQLAQSGPAALIRCVMSRCESILKILETFGWSI